MACREKERCRLGLHSEWLTEGTSHYRLACPSDHEGGPGVAHGGWTAGVLDEILGHVPLMHDQMCVTATLSVRFVKPVPIEVSLVGLARVDHIDGAKWSLSGELLLASSGAVLAIGTGVWVARDAAQHLAAFETWLAEQ